MASHLTYLKVIYTQIILLGKLINKDWLHNHQTITFKLEHVLKLYNHLLLIKSRTIQNITSEEFKLHLKAELQSPLYKLGKSLLTVDRMKLSWQGKVECVSGK